MMLTRQLSLKRGQTVRAVSLKEEKEIQAALTALDLPHPRAVIVLVGGAGRIGLLDKFPMLKAIRLIARLAEETGSVVIDGGTQAGIMSEIGKQRKRHHFSFPLIGVVFENLLMQREPKSILENNHTHFVLVPGERWGDESAWISKIATAIAGQKKSITILVNGGNIARTDVEYSLLENRPAVVVRGTGRMADEIPLAANISAVEISAKPDAILEQLRARLV